MFIRRKKKSRKYKQLNKRDPTKEFSEEDGQQIVNNKSKNNTISPKKKQNTQNKKEEEKIAEQESDEEEEVSFKIFFFFKKCVFRGIYHNLKKSVFPHVRKNPKVVSIFEFLRTSI